MKIQRLTTVALLCVLLLICSRTGLTQTSIPTGQTEKDLFARATAANQDSRHIEARGLLETLINRYPNSEYVPLAKLKIADSFLADGALNRAEIEYRDFITFFPNRPEVAEVQMKINSIQKTPGSYVPDFQ